MITNGDNFQKNHRRNRLGIGIVSNKVFGSSYLIKNISLMPTIWPEKCGSKNSNDIKIKGQNGQVSTYQLFHTIVSVSNN